MNLKIPKHLGLQTLTRVLELRDGCQLAVLNGIWYCGREAGQRIGQVGGVRTAIARGAKSINQSPCRHRDTVGEFKKTWVAKK